MRGLGRFSRPEGEPIDWSMELLLWQSGAVVALNGLVTSVVDEFVIIILILQPLFRHRRQLILAQLAEWINWAVNHNDLSFGSVSPPIKRQLQQSVSAFNALSIRPASPNCLFQCVCVCVCRHPVWRCWKLQTRKNTIDWFYFWYRKRLRIDQISIGHRSRCCRFADVNLCNEKVQ